MENNIIEMKKESKAKTWIKDHKEQLISAGMAVTFGLVVLGVYACGYMSGKGPDVDEWVPVPFGDSDGKVGVSMLGLKNLSGGGAALVDHKDYLYEKHEYAANFANNLLDMIKEIDAKNS